MRTLLIVLFVFVGLSITSCKKDDSGSPYNGLWNTECDGHTGTMNIDGNTMVHSGLGCIVGTMKFTTSGNTISIVNQYTEYGQTHNATGTITENSMQLNWRVSGPTGYFVLKVKAVK